MIILNDIKYSFRLLSKRSGFTTLTILVMATGIGLSLYLFSFLNTMMFKPLPFKDGESLVQISSSENGVKNNRQINLHDYYEIRNGNIGLAEFSGYRNIDLNVSGRDGSRRYNAVAVEPNIFALTRTKPIIGREFTSAENQKGAEPVVVLGYDAWQNQFGGSDQIIDQIVRINGEGHRIIGVMPKGYFFPVNAEMWVLLREDATQSTRGNSSYIYGLAHIADGANMEQVNREIAVIMQRLEERYPKTNKGTGAYIETLQKATVGDAISVIYSMQIVALLILLLASINVGNLLFSRAIEREKETAIRVALGAPRSRLISQMLWESIIICTIGGMIGLLVLAWGLKATEAITRTFFVDGPRFWWKFGIDAYTMKLFLIFVVGTILITGLLPAWKNSGANFNLSLRDGTRGALGKKAGRLSKVLVIVEIFISMIVLIAAAVMVLGTYKSTHANYGADTTNVLTAKIRLTESAYATPEEQGQFVKALKSRLENSSGIKDVMISSALPGENASIYPIALEGKEYMDEKSYPSVNYIVVTPDALSKLGVELKEGRYFDNTDDEAGKKSVIVTESFIARYMPGESPIGKRIRIVRENEVEQDWVSIIGVVAHTIQGAAYEQSGKMPSVFRPFTQNPRMDMAVAMRVNAEDTETVFTLRKTLESIDPELPAFSIESYESVINRQTAPLKFITSVFLMFGIAAIALASSGIYGVMANTINQRTQEIGVKCALGATEQRITKEFLMKGVSQLLWGGVPGALLGCTMGYALSKIIGTGDTELVIVAMTTIIAIGAIVMTAIYLPTKRVLQLEPSQALRYE